MTTITTVPPCEKLRFDVIERELFCAFRLTKYEKTTERCCYDDETVEELKKDGYFCPLWKNRDE